MEEKKLTEEKKVVELPEGKLCSGNCADGCVYWEPYKKDSHGRQWCNWYDTYYYPSERNGCLSKK